ncbi:surfeit locus protein 6 [Tenrec ecaudatus]|uniref:surfeit locus protein 6 n=1 Tax=Tenrec ecaudatus TaxID=94439 RepID=UPI003F59356F
MKSLLAQDAYLQGLARKICAQPAPEPRFRPRAGKTRDSEAAGSPKKKRKKKQKQPREQTAKASEHKAQPLGKTSPALSGAKKPEWADQEGATVPTRTPAGHPATEPESLFALDVLRQRLQEKIQEARGQGPKELSPAALEKRRRRKQERERKKRKRKELRAQEKAARAGKDDTAPEPAPNPEPPEPTELIFNKVEVGEEDLASGKAKRRKEKRQQVKGHLTPLTGRNYRQLLERLQARQAKVEELREQDAGRARELEAKMQWTNLLYKAEGVKIRDSEPRLQEALKRKEKRRAQRARKWEKRTANVIEKMQQRQDKRRQHLRKQKAAKAERRMEKARKKGRVLPQDLERAGLA